MPDDARFVWIPIADLPQKMQSTWTYYDGYGSIQLYGDIINALSSRLISIRGKRSLRISLEKIDQLIDEQSIDDLSVHTGQVSLPNRASFSPGPSPPIGQSALERIEYNAIEVDWTALERYVKSELLPLAVQKPARGRKRLTPNEGETPKEFVKRMQNNRVPRRKIAMAIDFHWPEVFTDQALEEMFSEDVGIPTEPNGVNKQGKHLRI